MWTSTPALCSERLASQSACTLCSLLWPEQSAGYLRCARSADSRKSAGRSLPYLQKSCYLGKKVEVSLTDRHVLPGVICISCQFNTVQRMHLMPCVALMQWKEMAEQQQVLPKISRPRQACHILLCVAVHNCRSCRDPEVIFI